ncbi:MAG: DUF3786 domain-containing protein [Deltaproteobacteria bacterium]
MPRIDDYKQALKLAADQLRDKDLEALARLSGAVTGRDKEGRKTLVLDALNQKVSLTWPDFAFSPERPGAEIPIQQQILYLHYLCGAWSSKGAGASGQWISFQEIPDGRFYMDAFQRRAKNPMVMSFGDQPELLLKVATELYGAVPFDQGDASVVVRALPLVPIALILWKGDEEFPPEGNVLFDRSVVRILSAEDIAWLSGMVVYPLIGRLRAKA